jgi:hypothetical protein
MRTVTATEEMPEIRIFRNRSKIYATSIGTAVNDGPSREGR